MEVADSFKQLQAQARDYYNSIGKVNCPALGEINFTSEGFHHLRYERANPGQKQGKERTKQERRNKFAHISNAVETLKQSTTIQEIRTTIEPVGKIGQNGMRSAAKVTYYGFWAVLKNKRVKAIVRQIESGPYHFWSVMPYWTEMNGHKVFGSVRMADE